MRSLGSLGKPLTPSLEKDAPRPLERNPSDEKTKHATASTDTTTPEQASKLPRRLSKSMSTSDVNEVSPQEQPSQLKKVAFLATEEEDIMMRSMDSGRSISGALKMIRDINTGQQQVR